MYSWKSLYKLFYLFFRIQEWTACINIPLNFFFARKPLRMLLYIKALINEAISDLEIKQNQKLRYKTAMEQQE